MKILLALFAIAILAVLVVSVSADCGCAGNGKAQGCQANGNAKVASFSLAGDDSGDASGNGTPSLIAVRENIKERIRSFLGAGNKSIVIENPRGNISITITTENGTKTIEIAKDFENIDSFRKITITPGHAEIETEVETENGTAERNLSINWTPVIRARIRQLIRNMTCEEQCPLLNITFNNSLKKAIIISGNLSALVNNTIEIDNETVYIKTLKGVRKELKVLPENASETAKLRVNYHLVKAVEIQSDDGSVYYAIKGTQLGKLLWLFPVEMDVQTDVDINSGEVKQVHRPWWSFLVTG